MKINLASTRLAFFLIASLFFLILISAIIPQQDIALGQISGSNETIEAIQPVIDKLGLDRIYFTPTFFVILGLLAINLAIGNIKRFRLVYRAEKKLLKFRHLGSIIFHLSLILIMASVILHFLFQYHGVIAVTEGQTINDHPDQYFREFKGPLYTDQYEQFALRLDSLENLDDNSNSPESRAEISLIPVNSKPRSASIQINHPFYWRDLEFHYGALSGYSPEITLADTSGRELIRTFVRVANTNYEELTKHFDYLMLPSLKAKIEIEVLPPTGDEKPAQFNISFYQDSLVTFSGQLGLGQTVSFDNYRLTVSRLRRWCYISAIRNPYLGLIFTSFWVALAGMTIGFIPRVINRN